MKRRIKQHMTPEELARSIAQECILLFGLGLSLGMALGPAGCGLAVLLHHGLVIYYGAWWH
jgi:hypothetical protein